MIIDTQNTFFWKKDITTNTNSDVVMNGNGGDADPNLFLVIRIDKTVTGTPLFNVYTSDKDNMADAVLLHGITMVANAPAGTEYKVRLANGAKKYIRINANNMTGGTISSFLTSGINIK